MLKEYSRNLFETGKRGDTREESFYGDLSELLENYAHSHGFEDIHVTTLPKQTETGNPDFRIWDGTQEITGYIEAKRPSKRNLDSIEGSEQLERYRDSFDNLILTNFFEFRLYRSGELIDATALDYPGPINKIQNPPSFRENEELYELLNKFFSFSVPSIDTAEKLAVELAKKTKFLRDDILKYELNEGDEDNNRLRQFHEAFQEYLIGGIDEEDFADLYAQTITYGLFAARTRSGSEFNRRLAYDQIPNTIGILRDIFQYISLGEVPAQLEWIVDDISEVLAKADVGDILESYFHEGRGKDPVVHFYETFLAEYDPETRERRGVYYTPEPVVSYITRSINKLLKEHFGRDNGLADNDVKVLDPAAGTTTFLGKAAQVAVDEFKETYGGGGVEDFISEHILEDYYGFELMMAPYAIGHLKMSYMLEELGHKLKQDDRFKLYLTNTLEMEELEESRLPGMSSLSEESHLAGEVKKDTPILAILGNPPYFVHSANNGEWIERILKEGYQLPDGSIRQSYYEVDGRPLQEKNPKNLQNDYDKFLRFAQWKIDQAEEGVVGFITNHSFLESPTFRGMRQSLMQTFDKLYFLDLHGNIWKGNTGPENNRDENVFDIKQGVCISLLIKDGGDRAVYKSNLWGKRESKYEFLSENNLEDTEWEQIRPSSPFYLFSSVDREFQKQYQDYPSLKDVFPVKSSGVKTHRDKFVTDFDKESLITRVNQLISKDFSNKELKEIFNITEKDTWQLSEVRSSLRNDERWEKTLRKFEYKPFEERWIVYHDELVDRPRRKVMSNMTKENIGFIGMRNYAYDVPTYNYAFVSDKLINTRIFISQTGTAKLFPLFLYKRKEDGKSKLFKGASEVSKSANINKSILKRLNSELSNSLNAKEILGYIYAILYSKAYRIKYSDYLETDYPRIPFTKETSTFERLIDLGIDLIDSHLLKKELVSPPSARFEGKGNNIIAKTKRAGRNYHPKENRVYINKDEQYFGGIPPEAWDYQIGGYQVLDKWLKDRRERQLSLDEIKKYCKIVTAIKNTIDLQQKIDEVFSAVEEETIDFNLRENK